MMHLVARLARMTALPALLVALSIASPLASAVSAQDVASAGTQDTLTSTTVMLPMGEEMVQVTVRMPATPTFIQPQVRLIPGVGYEID